MAVHGLLSLIWQATPHLAVALLLVLVFRAVIRQNREDLRDVEAWMAKPGLPTAPGVNPP